MDPVDTPLQSVQAVGADTQNRRRDGGRDSREARKEGRKEGRKAGRQDIRGRSRRVFLLSTHPTLYSIIFMKSAFASLQLPLSL